MPPGTIRPTSEFSTVRAGAMVAPPSVRAMPSATGPGMTARTARLVATPPSSQPSCRLSAAWMCRVPNHTPPNALPTPQTASRMPPTLSAWLDTYDLRRALAGSLVRLILADGGFTRADAWHVIWGWGLGREPRPAGPPASAAGTRRANRGGLLSTADFRWLYDAASH